MSEAIGGIIDVREPWKPSLQCPDCGAVFFFMVEEGINGNYGPSLTQPLVMDLRCDACAGAFVVHLTLSRPKTA